MALFGKSSKNLARKLESHSWKSDEERTALITEFKGSRVKPVEVIPLLWNKDHAVRGTAASIFTKQANTKAVTALMERLLGMPTQHRKFAMRLIVRMDEEVIEPAVQRFLSAAQAERRRLGWEVGLNLQGSRRRAFHERALRDAPPTMARIALQDLLSEHKRKDLKPLLLSMLRAPDDRLRARVVEALTELRAPDVFEAMANRFQHESGIIRELAGKYLREYAAKDPESVRTRVMHMLSQGDDATRHLSVEILMATGEPIEVLLEVFFYCRGLVSWLKDRIFETLRNLGDEFLRPAVELLGHPDEEIRSAALVLAEAFDDPRVVGPVCRLLESEDWWHRISACDVLGRIGDDRAVPPLLKMLHDPDTRWAAIDALARISSSAALKPLIELLKDKRPEVRLEVVQAVGQFEDKRVLGLLKQVAEKDPVMDVRIRASEVARLLGEKLKIDVEGKIVARIQRKPERPLDRMLTKIREDGASDLHLAANEPPFMRKHGVLERIPVRPLPPAAVREIIESVMSAEQLKAFDEAGELDFCYTIDEVGRYRSNAYQTLSGLHANFRVIPNIAPTFSDLGLPSHLTEMLDYHQGVILVTGAAGSGKSTTLAALVNLINESRSRHILSLEEPVEFVHSPKTALVNQRNIGRDSESFSRALRAALREDPDIIVVGELRDPETARMSLEAAETGHLVITTMPTNSAVATIERLVGSFPPEEQAQVRMSLAESLKFVISQSLLPRADGKGRVAAYEILKGTFAVGAMIRDAKTIGIPSLMQIGQTDGMQTLDMALEELLERGLITPEVAHAHAGKPERFETRCSAGYLESLEFISNG